MKITHLAIWSNDLERSKLFYHQYFKGTPGTKYSNPEKNFESYFMTFDNGCKLEIMHKTTDNQTGQSPEEKFIGISHIAFSVGSENIVKKLTGTLKKDGYFVVSEPRITGDGYFESCVLDPDNNRIEITV